MKAPSELLMKLELNGIEELKQLISEAEEIVEKINNHKIETKVSGPYQKEEGNADDKTGD